MSGKALARSYDHCAEIARREARNFYYAFLVMPREKRRAFYAIYAFLRHSDDISDDVTETAGIEARRNALETWRRRLTAALEGDYGGSELLPAFHDAVQRFAIPPELFYELIDGAEMDLASVRFRTFDDLYRYCYRVAGVVGLMCLRVFGYSAADEAEAHRRAEACGIAFQLTNILRDLREDAALGRVYLPQEDLERFEYPCEQLLEAQGGEAYERLVQFEADRAAGYYREAHPLLKLISPDCRPALWAMIALYGGILAQMRRARFPMLQRRVELSDMEKVHILARAWWMRLGGSASDPLPASALG